MPKVEKSPKTSADKSSGQGRTGQEPTKGGKRLRPSPTREASASKRSTAAKRPREFGAYKGKFSVGPEFFEPLSEEELEAWGER
jgi:hypothetical protein